MFDKAYKATGNYGLMSDAAYEWALGFGDVRWVEPDHIADPGAELATLEVVWRSVVVPLDEPDPEVPFGFQAAGPWNEVERTHKLVAMTRQLRVAAEA